jgi:hypothetical protein
MQDVEESIKMIEEMNPRSTITKIAIESKSLADDQHNDSEGAHRTLFGE